MPLAATYQVHPHGKLLLSAEYFVLDGALAIALPTKLGQALTVTPGNAPNQLSWKSFTPDGQCWFTGEFTLSPLAIRQGSNAEVAERLLRLLASVQNLQPGNWREDQSFQITTQLDFSREWGLGSSSTLVSALARWTGVDPYALLAATFGGSGYDLACAFAEGPILYQKRKAENSLVEIPFRPAYHDQLYFVYLGKKQNSREGITRYRKMVGHKAGLAQKFSTLSLQMAVAPTLADFEGLILEHEKLIGIALQLPRARSLYFEDFPGEIKSLGAWGGDFVLATSPLSPEETRQYFQKRGFGTVFSYQELIL